VEWIRAKEVVSGGEGQGWYLVRWQGYGAAADSWEPTVNLVDSARQLVVAYEARAAELAHTSDDELALRPCVALVRSS
jgi:hypothetical protein